MTDREVCIVLNMISGIGFTRFAALRNYFGSIAASAYRTSEEYSSVAGIGEELAGKLSACNWSKMYADEADLADRCGVRIISYFDENYPDILRRIYDPPLVLYVRGRLGVYPDRTVAMVGTRRSTGYGRRMAEQLAVDAVNAGFTVVSGLAYGIDTCVHRAVVKSGGTTVAVVGGGLKHITPKENIPLAVQIVESGGAIISEFPMDFPVNRTCFPRRNRIVAALCKATIVVEAGVDSGALITAKLALENGSDVFALPGMADNPMASGCHKLIKEGAGLIENFDDVLEYLGFGFLPGINPDTANRDGEIAFDRDSVGDLPDLQRKILQTLDDGNYTLEELQDFVGVDTAVLLSELMQLEMKFLIERDPSLRYCRIRRR